MTGMLKDSIDKKSREEKVYEILDFLKLRAIEKTIVSNLTPLESKLVELARAMATSPKLILLDELLGACFHPKRIKFATLLKFFETEDTPSSRSDTRLSRL